MSAAGHYREGMPRTRAVVSWIFAALAALVAAWIGAGWLSGDRSWSSTLALTAFSLGLVVLSGIGLAVTRLPAGRVPRIVLLATGALGVVSLVASLAV